MLVRTLWLATLVLSLAGCASAPPAPAQPWQFSWQDQVFIDANAAVTVTKEELFRLDPELQATLESPTIQLLSPSKRLDRLIALLYGREVKRFAYAAGHSTVATDTWQNKRGDCLSLTVLAYAMARAMNLDAEMQEVPVAAVFDRRGQIDFLSQHVNVRFRNASPVDLPHGTSTMPSRDMILDFEPELGGRHVGEVLSDQSILARYYNNLAAEHLSNGRPAQAYAHFKAAILADPEYAASYGNLALLYRSKGLLADAEHLLRHAVALGKQAYVPLHTLHQLLQEQGRDTEAREVERLLDAKRNVDPYHWIGLGLRHLHAGEYRSAIRALKRAQSLTTGFEEVHRYLALAYWRVGEPTHAQEQLAVLSTLHSDSADLSRLRKKITTSP